MQMICVFVHDVFGGKTLSMLHLHIYRKNNEYDLI